MVGAATFCAIGVMVSALIPNADAAPAIVNGILFPVLFISGVFFPVRPDSVLATIGDIFPISHFVDAVFAAFDPRLADGVTHGFAWGDIAVLAIWGVGAALVAVWKFQWEPRAPTVRAG